MAFGCCFFSVVAWFSLTRWPTDQIASGHEEGFTLKNCVFSNVTYNGFRNNNKRMGLIQGRNMNVYDCTFSNLTFYNDGENEFGLFGTQYQTSSSGSTTSSTNNSMSDITNDIIDQPCDCPPRDSIGDELTNKNSKKLTSEINNLKELLSQCESANIGLMKPRATSIENLELDVSNHKKAINSCKKETQEIIQQYQKCKKMLDDTKDKYYQLLDGLETLLMDNIIITNR